MQWFIIRLISWVIPFTDDCNRAAMPSTVRTKDGKTFVAVRVRDPRDDDSICRVDTYISEDNGRTWSFLSKVGDTGLQNGNPRTLTLLRDGRVACSYANRSLQQMLVRFSSDDGATWDEEIVIRDNQHSHDMGYPQMVQNANGNLVALYYLATDERPHSYIEAAIFKP